MTFEHINPEELGVPRGWTNGMLAPKDGRLLFIAGQDAAEVDGVVVTDDFVQQFDLVLGKILTIVREAGGGPEDLGRMTIFVTQLDEYRSGRHEIGERYRARMGKHFPAMALVEVRGLLDPGAKVEIEATAVIPNFNA